MVSPTVDLFSSILALRVSKGCLDRIQTFLRLALTKTVFKRNKNGDGLIHSLNIPNTSVEIKSMPVGARDIEDCAIKVTGLDLRPIIEADLILKTANFNILEVKLTVITGPNGCRKTTLLKALLGEVNFETGFIRIYTSFIAYCSQVP
ncbi:hypothetical protein PG994_005461 [Apiospora phragmitis]|uniref:ABC transporter domain-containing protein n=1 Tax=Apiospora phragmitis TaxID=2905665 RepID=A0ABR1VCB1_9PEZI